MAAGSSARFAFGVPFADSLMIKNAASATIEQVKGNRNGDDRTTRLTQGCVINPTGGDAVAAARGAMAAVKRARSLAEPTPRLMPPDYYAHGQRSDIQAAPELALRFRQRSGLDEQALPFIAAPPLAEANHHGVPWAFRLGLTREQRIPGGQEFKIAETGASQACRPGILHDKQIAAAAAPVTLPGITQRLDYDQLGRTARPLRQALLLLVGELPRNPMSAVKLFDRRIATLAEAQRLPRRRAGDMACLARGQALGRGP